MRRFIPSVDSARQVHSDHALAVCVDRSDGRTRVAVEIARESCAEQRVDDEVGVGERRCQRLQFSIPLLGRFSGIAFQRLA